MIQSRMRAHARNEMGVVDGIKKRSCSQCAYTMRDLVPTLSVSMGPKDLGTWFLIVFAIGACT